MNMINDNSLRIFFRKIIIPHREKLSFIEQTLEWVGKMFLHPLSMSLYVLSLINLNLKQYTVGPKIWNQVVGQARLRELSFRVNATLDTTDPREMPSDRGRRKKEEGRRKAPYENRESNRRDGNGRGSKVVDRPISPYPHYGFTGIIPFQNAVRMCGFELGSSQSVGDMSVCPIMGPSKIGQICLIRLLCVAGI